MVFTGNKSIIRVIFVVFSGFALSLRTFLNNKLLLTSLTALCAFRHFKNRLWMFFEVKRFFKVT